MPSTTAATRAPLRLTTLALAGALALGATFTTAVALHAQEAGTVSVSTVTDDLGTYLVDAEGMTLYYFTPDTPGASVCSGECLEAWPALEVPADGSIAGMDTNVTGWLAAIERDDGTLQAAYRGRPLYSFQGDQAAGDTNGQGLGDVWYVAAEDGSVPDPQVPSDPELVLEAVTDDALGTYITGADGLTAYYFTVDTTPGASMCGGDCLEAWPPVTVSDGISVAAGEGVPGVVGVITATDGSTPQVTYDGRPLYYFQGDQAAGDTNGQGVGDVWFVATVDGQVPTGE